MQTARIGVRAVALGGFDIEKRFSRVALHGDYILELIAH